MPPLNTTRTITRGTIAANDLVTDITIARTQIVGGFAFNVSLATTGCTNVGSLKPLEEYDAKFRPILLELDMKAQMEAAIHGNPVSH